MTWWSRVLRCRLGSDATVREANDYRFFAGWRSDPFFFDAGGALNDLPFTGDDFFADKDVCSIALEIPNGELGDPEVGLWHRTLVPAMARSWVQVERGARTQVVLPPPNGEEKEAYSGASRPTTVASLTVCARARACGRLLTGGGPAGGGDCCRTHPYDPERAVLTRTTAALLTDDVADPFLAILTNGKVTEDKVGPHDDLLPDFPYLGPPHENRAEA